MWNLEQINAFNRQHPFTLPKAGDKIISSDTQISYVIGSEFAGGGFGRLFHCTDDWGHDLVAKVLRPVGDEQEMEARAVSEIVSANIARSPHIVHVHDAFVYKGAYYIISERCASSLHTHLRKALQSREMWFPALCKAVLHALHYMHTRGLVHGDVHAGNVLFHCKYDALLPAHQSAIDFKLGDFGQTRLIGSIEPGATWNEDCFPPEASDPEEFGPLDHRIDLYQAGLLFLRFLSDREVEFDRDDILSGRPREIAESLMHPAGEAIAIMLRRHAEFRPENALVAWGNMKDVLVKS